MTIREEAALLLQICASNPEIINAPYPSELWMSLGCRCMDHVSGVLSTTFGWRFRRSAIDLARETWQTIYLKDYVLECAEAEAELRSR